MSNALREVLDHRADSAPMTDPQAVLVRVRERAEQRRRVRRNTAAAGGGVALVAALIVGALVLPSGHDSESAPAGGSGNAATASSGVGRSARAAASRQVTAQRSAVAAQRSAASLAAAAVASRAVATRSLIPVTTPGAAGVAVGLVPAGWRYSGHNLADAFYGPASLPMSTQPDFDAVIVVDVHERITPDGPNNLTIGGRAGRYGTDGGVQTVSVIVDSTTELDVQIPVSAHVTKAQALQIAATLDLRSTAEKTHG